MEREAETPRSTLDDRLLDMVLARDLRFDSDELERVAALLATYEHSLKDAVTHESDTARKAEIQRRLAALERVLEKVDEACVMI